MEFKDYYKIMGLGENASQEDIKHAYRKLARKYHPDVSKEKDAEERFKELGEAYEALKDPEKRKAYDQLRKGGWRSGDDFSVPPGWQQNQEFRGGGFTQGDAEQFSDFFETLFGRADFMGGGGRARQREYKVRGEDLFYSVHISLEEAFHGTTRALQLRVPELAANGRVVEKTKTLNVKIPAGVTQGQRIRLRGQGAPGQGGAEAGDLYLEVQIAANDLYHLDGRDITVELPVTPWEAALGATVRVPTLSGPIEMKIPPDSQTGRKLRIKGKGLPGKTPGDEYVMLRVVLPESNSSEAKRIYQEMADKLAFNPRQHMRVDS